MLEATIVLLIAIAQRLTAVIIGALLVLNVCQGNNTSPYRPSDLFIANSLCHASD